MKMTLKFHNTLTGRVDEFISQHENQALVYTCGPTAYDYMHIGNWMAYIYWDILIRILIANDYEVTRVINITDVGHLTSDADEGQDKLEKGARREGKTAWEIAKFYADDFKKGLQRLNMIQPQFIAKATDYLPQQLDIVRKLQDKGYTYQIDDGIYFDTSKFPSYADFAHLNLNALQAGARVEFNSQKRNPSDFALWKFTPAGEIRDMEWETPVELLDSTIMLNLPVMGFPGWHLECSAMAMALLGQTLDIHTGGIDHIPVHHTNEIAQSEAITGVRFSNYWLHNNHLKVNGTKISKSLGNGYTLNDLENKGYSMQDFRMFALQSNYKHEGNFTFDNLTAAKNRLQNWRDIAVIRHQIHDGLTDEDNKITDNKAVPSFATCQAIVETVSNDLDTPNALSLIDEIFAKIAKSRLSNISRPALTRLLETINDVLGIQLIETTPDISDEAKQMIIERRNAREEKNWAKSDTLRKELAEMNISVRDNEHDTVWAYIQ